MFLHASPSPQRPPNQAHLTKEGRHHYPMCSLEMGGSAKERDPSEYCFCKTVFPTMKPTGEEEPNHWRSFDWSTGCQPSQIQAPFTLLLLKLHLPLPQHPADGPQPLIEDLVSCLQERGSQVETARPRPRKHFPAWVKRFVK